MNLQCLNTIIPDNLAIHIDLTDIKSWNLNTGLTSYSLTKWTGAISDNINLIDFGLTGFDNGRTDKMWEGITLIPSDTLFSMYRVGYNTVHNPTVNETSGLTATTQFLPMSGITATTGNYFNLNGGYLQGFFKLRGYDYQLLPARYNKGITIETILDINSNSSGIFYMMGARAEDKYCPYFSGETLTEITTTGVTTSLGNYLNALRPESILKTAFSSPENKTETIYIDPPMGYNINNNVIAFELTSEKKLAYKYVNNDGIVVTNSSPYSITATGFTLITITFTPDGLIDPDILMCAAQRTGKLMFYINGRSVWTIKEFPEFYFTTLLNNVEKQLGVPYSISWGGGSFGLKESWHYDYQTYNIYREQDTNYIVTNFFVQDNPIATDCYLPSGNYLAGLELSADNTKFTEPEDCNPDVQIPITVMKIEVTGTTGSTYFVKFNNPVSVLSNRNYVMKAKIYCDGFFNRNAVNKVSLIAYKNEAELLVVSEITFNHPMNAIDGEWVNIERVFKAVDNSGQNMANIGLLIQSTTDLISGGTIYVDDFEYTAADILVKDSRKNNLLIQQNFNSSFIGGIQKLRIYDNALTSTEVLHNAIIEAEKNSQIIVSKGGRIIHR